MATSPSLSRPTRCSDADPRGVVPYTLRLRDGRYAYIDLPAAYVTTDRGGELLLLPPAVRLLDSVRALALKVESPTPGHIVSLRKALGMTQTEFGRKLHVNKMTVYRWERGAVTPKPESVAAIERLRAKYARRGVVVSQTDA